MGMGCVRVSDSSWLLCTGAFVCAAIAPPAQAQSNSPSTACHFEVFGTGTVARVVDGRGFVLDDGREVRLAAIEVPPAPEALETGPRAAAGAAAKAALESMLAGQTVALHGHPRTDRYGRVMAHAQVAGTGLAAEMVSRG